MGNVENATAFADSIRTEFRRMEDEVFLAIIKDLASNALADLIYYTPVDTGYARSGWIVTFDTPSSETLPEDSSDKKGAATFSKGLKVIEGMPKYPSIFMSNNTEYIEILNAGRWAGEAIGEGEFAFGAGVTSAARRTGARGSIQSPDGILNPTFQHMLDSITEDRTVE